MGAIRYRPDDAETHTAMGGIHRSQGRATDARDCFLAARDLAPGHASVHYNLGLLYRDLSQLDLAELCLQQAVAIDPGSTEALLNWGVVLAHQGRISEAISKFEDIQSIEPQHIG